MVYEPQGWTIYGCNNFSEWEQIWLQSILFTKGTKYNCNHKSKKDHIWLQSFRIRTKYDCNPRNRARVTWLWFLNESLQNKISIMAVIFDPYLNGLQSYMVRFGFLIAIIFCPFRDQHCNHIWSLLRSRLQSYLVPIIKLIAIICGPAL